MGTAREPASVKLFLAAMYRDENVLTYALDICIKEFGNIDMKYGPVEVSTYTNYYDREMEKGIRKCYMTFEKLVQRDDLVNIKTSTNKIEESSMKKNKRTVNLDPGYLTTDKLILASTKDFYHRVYLEKGIYAEVTLHFRKGIYRFFSWTYPDYKNKELQEFLMKVRDKLVKEARDIERES